MRPTLFFTPESVNSVPRAIDTNTYGFYRVFDGFLLSASTYILTLPVRTRARGSRRYAGAHPVRRQIPDQTRRPVRQHETGDRDGVEHGLQREGLHKRVAVSTVLGRMAAVGAVPPTQDRQGVRVRHGRHQDADATLLQEQILGVLVHARVLGRWRAGHSPIQAHNENKERECPPWSYALIGVTQWRIASSLKISVLLINIVHSNNRRFISIITKGCC